jgi:UDP-N-acetylmuramoyl-L-alanyl-D-glutamate--2,6-diaminopimelate ligase
VRLSDLASALPHQRGGPPGDPDVLTVTHDSRRVTPGALFAAFPGLKADGRTFIPDAAARGAVAALGLPPEPPRLSVPYLEVENPRRCGGLLAARLAGNPSGRLVMVGVTGTSGKTTTTSLIDRILATKHPRRGFFGTLGYQGIPTTGTPGSHTTPEATDLQPMLAALAADGGTAVSMECSSHAMTLERVAGCAFDAAVFLNLSRDHLDFHGDMERYFEAKTRLFSLLKPAGKAVVNLADPWGRRLLTLVPGPSRFAFSLEGHAAAEVRGRAVPSPSGILLEATIASTDERLEIRSPLLGRPNAENLLAAAAAALALGFPPADVVRTLAAVDRVPGRLETVPNGRGLTVLVDYAHKPAALEGVLRTVREMAVAAGGRVIVVFGCGGDRDRGKRPEMGRIAATLADEVIVTSDNPRSEAPEAILQEILAGVRAAGRTAAGLVDRREAIAEALKRARPKDVVLIAGKGHETVQVFDGHEEPFDDRLVARELLGEPA